MKTEIVNKEETIQARVPRELKEEFVKILSEKDLNTSQVIRKFMAEYVRKHKHN